jgi:hypothetical protein
MPVAASGIEQSTSVQATIRRRCGAGDDRAEQPEERHRLEVVIGQNPHAAPGPFRKRDRQDRPANQREHDPDLGRQRRDGSAMNRPLDDVRGHRESRGKERDPDDLEHGNPRLR